MSKKKKSQKDRKPTKKVKCPDCGKQVWERGLFGHRRFAHRGVFVEVVPLVVNKKTTQVNNSATTQVTTQVANTQVKEKEELIKQLEIYQRIWDGSWYQVPVWEGNIEKYREWKKGDPLKPHQTPNLAKRIKDLKDLIAKR